MLAIPYAPRVESSVNSAASDPATGGRLRRCNAIVIGAGVAGAAAALGLARRLGTGQGVMLVERSTWPRPKVCGCCINASAVAALDRFGILRDVRRAGAVPLDAVSIRRNTRKTHVRVEPGLGLARATLDACLVDATIRAGVVFVPETRAEVLPLHPSTTKHATADIAVRQVMLHHRHTSEVHFAGVVIVADGLAGSSLDRLDGFGCEIAPGSWMGLSTTIESANPVPSGEIMLCVGDHGYVGLVALEGGSTHLAAAIDSAWVKSIGGPASAVREILHSSGEQSLGNLEACRFSGTPALTRRRPRLAEQGLFVLGDAAGYVEPFTGEGMAWALGSAEEVISLAADAIGATADTQTQLAAKWQACQSAQMRRQQRRCRYVRAILHRPWLADAAMIGLSVGLVRRAVERAIRPSIATPRPTQTLAPVLSVPRGRT